MRGDYFISLLFFFQVTFVESLLEFLRDVGPWITVAGTIIGIIVAVRRNILFKISRTMGEEQLFDCVVIVAELMKDLPVQDIKKLLLEFRKKSQLEYGMKESLLDINRVLTVKQAINLPNVTEILSEYKRRKDSAAIKNKKRWDEVRKGTNMSVALNSVLEILNAQIIMHSKNAEYKLRITAVNELIESIKKKIPENREIRKKLEEIREKAETVRNIEKLDKTRDKLYQIFTKMPDNV